MADDPKRAKPARLWKAMVVDGDGGRSLGPWIHVRADWEPEVATLALALHRGESGSPTGVMVKEVDEAELPPGETPIVWGEPEPRAADPGHPGGDGYTAEHLSVLDGIDPARPRPKGFVTDES